MMVLGALLCVAVAIILLVAALLAEDGGLPLTALSLLADAVAGALLAIALRRRRGTPFSGPTTTISGPDSNGPRSAGAPGALPSGHFPPDAAPRA
jgi:hypothetical protein